jgi:hypothetical protein
MTLPPWNPSRPSITFQAALNATAGLNSTRANTVISITDTLGSATAPRNTVQICGKRNDLVAGVEHHTSHAVVACWGFLQGLSAKSEVSNLLIDRVTEREYGRNSTAIVRPTFPYGIVSLLSTENPL